MFLAFKLTFAKKSISKRFSKCSLKNICTSNNIPEFSQKELILGLGQFFNWFDKLHFCPRSVTLNGRKTVSTFQNVG